MKEFTITKRTENGGKVKIKMKAYEWVDKGRPCIICEVGDKTTKVSYLDKEHKAIVFPLPIKISGKEIKGLLLENNVWNELHNMYERVKKEKEEMIREAFEHELMFTYYYLDWYRANGFFVEIEKKEGDKVFREDKLVYEMITKHLMNRYKLLAEEKPLAISESPITKNVTHMVEKYFGFACKYDRKEVENLKKKLEKEGFKVVFRKIDWVREECYYVRELIAPIDVWNKVFDKIYKPMEEKIRIEKEKEKEEIEKALKEAKKANKDVMIKRLFYYDGDDRQEVELHGTKEIKEMFGESELGIVNVYLYATSDGKLVEKHVPSF